MSKLQLAAKKQKTKPDLTSEKSAILSANHFYKNDPQLRSQEANHQQRSTVLPPRDQKQKLPPPQPEVFSLLTLEKHLFLAVKNDDKARINQLLAVAPDTNENLVNLQDRKGDTLAHYAAWFNQEEVIEFLLRFGADFDVCNHDGLTPLMLASIRGYISIVRILSNMTANIN